MEDIEKLVLWAKQNGAHLHKDVQIYEDADFGISLKTKSSLPQGSEIVSCPFGISLSYFNALDAFPTLSSHTDHGFPQEAVQNAEPHVIGHFFLILNYLLEDSSFWAGYIRCLPQPDESEKLGTPVFGAIDDRKFLAGTQVGTSVEVRERQWREEWKLGRDIMEAHEDYLQFKGKWTWELYRWAATIFSSRSFISTLIPDRVFSESNNSSIQDLFTSGDAKDRSAKTFKSGTIPVLFPLLDIANHSPQARVTWMSNVQSEPMSFSLMNETDLPKEQQIFNNYAPKGNSQLFLGYGFLLPENDDITLAPRALTGDALAMQQGWGDSQIGADIITKNYTTYTLRSRPFAYSHPGRLAAFAHFEDGCVDHLALLVSNARERSYMGSHPDQRPEVHAAAALSGPMSRCILAVASALREMLQVMLDRMSSAGINLPPPSTPLQINSLAYRNGQAALLTSNIERLAQLLQSHISNQPCPEKTALLTLSTAFSHPSFHSPYNIELSAALLESIRAELEIEPDETLNWNEVEEDWGFTIWCLWLFGKLLDLWRAERQPGSKSISAWVKTIRKWKDYYGDTGEEGFAGEVSEWEAFEGMVKRLDLKKLGWEDISEAEVTTLMLEAGRIVFCESVILRGFKDEGGDEGSPRRLMCLYKPSEQEQI